MQNFDESPKYNSNQMEYLRNNSSSIAFPVKNSTHNSKLSNIEEKELEYSQTMQPTQTSVHHSPEHSPVNPFSPSPKESNYNSRSPEEAKTYLSKNRSPSRESLVNGEGTIAKSHVIYSVSPHKTNLSRSASPELHESSHHSPTLGNSKHSSHHSSKYKSNYSDLDRKSVFSDKDVLIATAKHPKRYQTGFDCCVNLIPVLPEYGYVNCMVGNRNCVAQYEIMENGRIKQTEILKSKPFPHNYLKIFFVLTYLF